MERDLPRKVELRPFYNSNIWVAGGGGGTTTGPDATRPPAICQNLRGGGGSAGGWGGGYWQLGRGAASDPLLPHAYLKGGGGEAWGYRGMYAIIAISCFCQEESLKGLKD